MRHSHRTTIAALGLAVLSGGCGKKPAVAPVAPVAETPRVVDDGSAAREAAERAAREAADAARRAAERSRATLEERVFFNYDEADLTADARRSLDEKVPLLRADGSIRLRIEGHADERGSTEYNLALGMRRAVSVVSYLAGYGVDVSRLQTVSFGEERPLVQGESESAWARNRRAEFIVTEGMGTVAEASGGR